MSVHARPSQLRVACALARRVGLPVAPQLLGAMPFGGSLNSLEGEQCVFCWGAGEDGQLCLEQAPTGEDEWHISVPTVRFA